MTMTPVLRCALAALAVSAGVPAAQAQPAAAPRRANACFYITQLNGFRADGDRTIYARASGRTIYRFDLAAGCSGLASHDQTIVLRPVSSGSICVPLDVDLSVRSHGVSERCIIADMHRLDADETAALPSRVRP
jgi:hypothetical protein